jgi:hypothetical protein
VFQLLSKFENAEMDITNFFLMIIVELPLNISGRTGIEQVTTDPFEG